MRKVSGYRSPSHVNQQVFDRAVAQNRGGDGEIGEQFGEGKEGLRPPTPSPTNGGKGSKVYSKSRQL